MMAVTPLTMTVMTPRKTYKKKKKMFIRFRWLTYRNTILSIGSRFTNIPFLTLWRKHMTTCYIRENHQCDNFFKKNHTHINWICTKTWFQHLKGKRKHCLNHHERGFTDESLFKQPSYRNTGLTWKDVNFRLYSLFCLINYAYFIQNAHLGPLPQINIC